MGRKALNTIDMGYGEKLRLLRNRARLTPAEVGRLLADPTRPREKDRLGVSARTIQWWENNEPPGPSLLEAAKLAEFFGVSVDFLVDDAMGDPRDEAAVRQVRTLAARLGDYEKLLDVVKNAAHLGFQAAMDRLLEKPEGARDFEPYGPNNHTNHNPNDHDAGEGPRRAQGLR
jgi:transcriptional regulator with XRE-family HTH domain